ncbi:uncharacterized protein BX663DRAFT_551254 [Cokeromyces recurvatus]|uniref:uncharacterized protein n=1 Tax=Cokeromyces recurvatus TaxID=90255 RepID=UPI00222017AB|nr:uncharacterized protein BX663DRAFT_551254 [Cokeromyces recurvatus]KAI7903535.1 hypothetical protein BX663DRAFT_551254 [Cokeromyces recurvatus]
MDSTSTTCSLYHICRSVLDRLSAVEGMANFLDCQDTTTDPLSKLTFICRQGFPLCTLYNALKPVKPLSVESDPNLNARNSCKANVYHFIVACRQELLFPEEDMFTISDLYQDDTNGFVKVVNTINKVLQLLEDRGIIIVRSSNRNSDPNAPKNTRDKVVLELLETERKYVQDMEILQNYMRELQIQKIVSPDTIHYLFGNLNALVDFQRRFLIQLEELAEKSPEEQRIGLLFIQMEDSFSVYEPYCANYYSAQDLVVQETPRLQKLADILNPTYQLPSMLIKPVQRICKYPLLLQELVKSTDKSWPYYHETLQSVEAIKRVTEKVNETQRQHENSQAVEELKKRLDDWKQITIDGYGNLMLQDKLFVSTHSTDNNERELHVFLFEKALLLCKESKGNNLLPKTNSLSINKKKRRGSLVPKIIVQTSCITDMKSRSKNLIWSLQMDLKGNELEQMYFKFRNEEQLKLWSSTLTKAIKKAISDRIPSQEIASTQLTSQYTDYDEDDDDENETDFIDDEDEEEDYIQQRSRSSSMHYYQQQTNLTRSSTQDFKYTNTTGRPYQNIPGMNLSPLPRSNSSLTTHSSSSNSSTTTTTTTTTTITTSPVKMNYPYYPASPPPSHPSSPTSSSRVSSTSTSSSTWHRLDNHTLPDMTTHLLTGEDIHQHLIQKQQQYSLLATGRSQSQSAAIERSSIYVNQNRHRSQSSPSITKNFQYNVPILTSASTTTTIKNSNESIPQLPTRTATKPTPLNLSHSYSSSQPIASSEPIVRNMASPSYLTDLAPPSPGTVKVKLNFNDGIYVIVTNYEVTFFELMEKVDKKIRLIANLKQKDILRLKYQDEDGDFITINSDDDVQMAFESRGIHNTVNLFITF